MEYRDLAHMIDHTVLRPETTEAGIVRLCQEARTFGFGAVCVAPSWVPLAVAQLAGTACRVVTVVGFPHGDTFPAVKVHEAQLSMEAGARELDMVIPVGRLKSRDREAVFQDIRSVVSVARRTTGTVVKVILETPLLTDEEKVLGCSLAEEAGADFVKTSTGFSGGVTTVRDVLILRQAVGKKMGVKAAGGIRDLETALAMIGAGANRLGCSASVAIVEELNRRPG